MLAKESFSPGDAMRDIYTRGLVTNDFVLVMGDLVSNIRIDEVVRVHKERRKTNKDAIMTMVVKESGGRHRSRSVVCMTLPPSLTPFPDRKAIRRCLYSMQILRNAFIMNQ